MKLTEQIVMESFEDKQFKIRLVEAATESEASFTHYLHNQSNEISNSYKKEAVNHVKQWLSYKFPEETVNDMVAEEALQQLLLKYLTSPFLPVHIQNLDS